MNAQRNMLLAFIKDGGVELHVSNGKHMKFSEMLKTADLVMRFEVKDGVVIPKVCLDRLRKDRKAKRLKTVEALLNSGLLLD